ncbi:major facilitator superfamily domain-containing 3 [Pelobates cultripes]|uniref:Major facilitator superfamily domain-containing 3 n=1 Tax=Pelobates cultripes TaxID=61616 RepID=A0AAD1S2I2_PELCU|nr:major facilitator superfamily domain-containing 3 [Pelobates cultripes]
MTSTYITLGILYLVQGFPYGIQSGLLPVLLRTQGLSLSQIGLTRVLYLPWLLKVLWSPLVDGHLSRRVWLRLSTGGLCICCLLCSLLPSGATFTPLAWLLLLMHVFSSLQDVALDAVSVAVLTREQVGVGNSLQVVAYKLGSVLAGGGSLTLLEALGWRPIFLLLAAAYFLAVLCVGARVLQSEESAKREELKDPYSKVGLREVIRKVLWVPGTMWTCGYVLMYKLGEQGSLSMVPLLLLDQGVSAAELGVFSGIISVVLSIAGSVFGGALLTKDSLHSAQSSAPAFPCRKRINPSRQLTTASFPRLKCWGSSTPTEHPANPQITGLYFQAELQPQDKYISTGCVFTTY